MPVPKRNARNLQDIRTLSGRVDQANQPYRAFMKIAALEMEKARRGAERESAMHRVRNIDARLREIEVEKADLLEILGERSNGRRSVNAPGVEEKFDPRRNTEGFKLRY